MMQPRTSIRVLICFFLSLVATPAAAVEFAVVGPRAAGMGGAGVAVTTDAYATYWNPAGLAMVKSMDIRIQGTVQVTGREGIVKALDDLKDFNPNDPSAANQTKAQGIANQINRPGATISGLGAGGLYFKGHFGEHAFGFNVSDVATSGSFVSSPVVVSGTNITGQMALRGLEARQAAFSYAYAFADKTFSVGITGKIIQGAAYNTTTSLQGGQDPDLLDNFGRAKISTSYGIDVGAMYRPSSWLRFGVVGKDINQPSFDAPGGLQYKLTPQVRGGVALNPWSTMTITADMDITSNQTLVPGLKSQVLSLGLEQTILSEFLSFRVGTYKNVQDAGSIFTPTAGIGMRIYSFRLDLAGGYDFNKGGAIASGALAWIF
ncbi:MAG TPA: conjugal transfer protein TraF [Nitrospiraceae bacterium]|nr:conjugal transfer protein TraF [Nitrospiraceae bacterium]